MNPIIIDNGSGSIKAGFAGLPEPTLHFPSYVGRPKFEKLLLTDSELEGDLFVGETATTHRGILKLSYPIQHGIVKNWSDMQKIWEYTFSELSIADSSTNPVLLTEAARNPLENRGKMAEIFFEGFKSPALYFQVSGILSLYASGRVTGTVLDSGDGVTSAVPVYEGFALKNAIQRVDVAGSNVTDYLQRLIGASGEYFWTTAEKETLRDIKEKVCYVVSSADQADLDARDDQDDEVPYLLPDGNRINIGPEKFQVAELLFNPSLMGFEQSGLHECVYKAIKKSDTDLRKTLFSNIILAGGSTLFPGLGNRLYSEIQKLSSKETKIKIYAPRKRLTSTWVGGSILGHLGTFKNMWVTKKEFEDQGKSVIYRKCF